MVQQQVQGKPLGGIVSTVVTPFDADDGIDEDLLRGEIRYLLDTGVHGICACGSTGEGHTLSVEESARICEIVVDEVAGRVPVIGGIIQNSTAQAVRYGHALKATGVDALQITPVHYVFAPSGDEIVGYYERIGNEVGLPIIVYNVVPWALIPAEVMDRVADLPQVVGIKQSGGDMHLVADLMERVSDRLTVLAAVDDLMYASFVLGADGALAAIPTVTPQLSVQLWDAVQAGDHALARSLHARILKVWRAIEAPNLPARIKEALRLQGRGGGLPRHPFTPVSEAESEAIKTALSSAGLLA
ncbi:dihydrodipicolinate synthase family protein [Saccharopolyspora phatthalungensis]|uniref:4-hydroxy-tetrahydrodipicolinate synthase n=1 Tax=Saccharopolyspora phatthalungensis TaxID=664693 RepID=A0A840QGL6_9PSEU|nr:dihydrodipicolinate synthase family protein [Saccharopolyspora phatthalungensis]MBB5157769.1 4-hydroxy-tetrahydrodipicolinate synthase [Saccharopolyspora phatthalungensis]